MRKLLQYPLQDSMIDSLQTERLDRQQHVVDYNLH